MSEPFPDTRDIAVEQTLRPTFLKDFIGQEKIKENLSVFIDSSKIRQKTLDHILLSGPPGLGKTTLAQIVAKEMNANILCTSGPAIEKQGDLAAILTNLEENSVLFIDEIHRLNKSIEEVLYSAMEDYTLDIMVGEGPGARSMRISLPEYTLIGATTKSGMLSSPLRDRFGIPIRFDFYHPDDLKQILNRSAEVLGIQLEDSAAADLSKRSRGTPRIAIRLLKRINDFAVLQNQGIVDSKVIETSLEKLEIDAYGLESLDRKLIQVLGETFNGGPAGISTLSVALSEDKGTVEDVCEPYLILIGLIQRTSRGRVLTEKGLEYFKKIRSNNGI